MKKVFFVLGVFVVVGALIMCGAALKNYGDKNVGNEMKIIKIIKVKEKENSNEDKENMLKNLNKSMIANISHTGMNSVAMISRKPIAINKIALKPKIDVKIEKIVVKNKNMKFEKIIILKNISIDEVSKYKNLLDAEIMNTNETKILKLLK